jgi:hypothetical protein
VFRKFDPWAELTWLYDFYTLDNDFGVLPTIMHDWCKRDWNYGPLPITDAKFFIIDDLDILSDKVYDWLKNNIKLYGYYNNKFWFRFEEDAILFKLTWL